MASGVVPKWCCMHAISEPKGDLIAFKQKSWKKFLECGSRWQNLACSEGETILKSSQLLSINFNADIADVLETPIEVAVENGAGYHRECYQLICNISKLAAAESKKRKIDEVDGKLNSCCVNRHSAMVFKIINKLHAQHHSDMTWLSRHASQLTTVYKLQPVEPSPSSATSLSKMFLFLTNYWCLNGD